jgi:hypothetical protein
MLRNTREFDLEDQATVTLRVTAEFKKRLQLYCDKRSQELASYCSFGRAVQDLLAPVLANIQLSAIGAVNGATRKRTKRKQQQTVAA